MLRKLLGLPPKHKHEWGGFRTSLSGWTIGTCATCGEKELF